jgi:hypothetical protein
LSENSGLVARGYTGRLIFVSNPYVKSRSFLGPLLQSRS